MPIAECSATNNAVNNASRCFEHEMFKSFLRAPPTKLAMVDGQLSTAHTLRYLLKAKRLEEAASAKLDPPLSQEVIEIQRLQGSNGQWQPSKRLHRALGGHVPDPPLGTKKWRWATALAVVFLQRRPEIFEWVYETYRRGLEWMDKDLLTEARIRLPPDNLYYPLDTDHVRDGQWQEGVSEALAEYGYAYFNQIHHTVQKTQRLELEQHSGEEDNLQPSPHSFRPLPQCCEVKETHQNELGALQEGTSRKKIHGINRDGNLTADEEEHAHGLGVELLLATSEVKRSFSRGDRVVCQWRQPTRLDHPRIDLAAWHPARVTEVHKDHHYVDVVFESGACERLSRVHVKHLHLAPHPNSIKPIPHEGEDIPTVALSSKSCRELAHIAKKNEAVQRTWNQIMPITEELKRLRGLCIKHSRRPEWQGTFPAVSCNMTRRLTTKRKKRIKLRNTQTKEQLQSPLPQERNVCDLQENTLNQSIHLGRQRTTPIATIVESSSGRGGNISSTVHSAQMVLIASVMAYEKCVSAVHDCIERGRTAYHEAHTYSEQHKAFEEVTANLGFYQPARAGYNDWRGQPVIGLQNATVDAIEAVGKWVEARCADAQGGGGGSHGTMRFFWKGQHFLLCIIDQTEHIFSRAPELGEWYGPGFPIHRNPFCLSYNLDERPCTPRNIMVRSFVNGEYTTTISPTLLMEREREETALKAITDRQEEAPSWWPARGMDKQHFQRIRSAERILLLEEQSINAKGQEPTLCMTVPR